jgi:hypothetical protein
MPKKGLKGEEITLIAQVVDGECMPKPVGVDMRNAGLIGDAVKQFAQDGCRQRPWVGKWTDREDRVLRSDTVKPAGKTAPDSLAGPFPEEDHPLLSLRARTLAAHLQALLGKAEIAKPKPA